MAAIAAVGIGLINSLGNAFGFAAPLATGWLADATGNFELGMWVVGIVVLLAAGGALLLRGNPAPLAAETEEGVAEVSRTQPTTAGD